jgi:flagellar biosynthetic protein FliR
MDGAPALMADISMFMLVLPRLGGVVATAPVFSSARFPALAKAGLAGVLAVLLLPVVPRPAAFPDGPLGLLALLASELLVGVTIGFAMTLVFTAIQVAGQIMDMELGFGIVNVIDPQYGTQMPLVGSFLQFLALLVFLFLDGHHLVLGGLLRSFQLVPVGGAVVRAGLSEFLVRLFSAMFATAVKISLPVLAAGFLANLALGLVARTVPQMNVFVIGLPVKVVVGLFILAAALPLFVVVVRNLSDGMAAALMDVLSRLAPGR